MSYKYIAIQSREKPVSSPLQCWDLKCDLIFTDLLSNCVPFNHEEIYFK